MLDSGRAAQFYAARLGWAVFPLAPRSKIPAIPKTAGGNGCKDATTDLERIRRWWVTDPTRNVGIATGAASGFFVVDIDPRSGGDVALEQLEGEHGALPETVEALTGGGGRHLLLGMVPALADVTWSPLAPGVDLKGTGGYIVAPPSVHPDGPVYAWEQTHRPLDVPIAAPAAWIVATLTGQHRRRSYAGSDVAALDGSILAQLFRAADWLGPVVRDGVRAVRCPSESLHTTGTPFDSSTVLFAPQRGHDLGWFYCAHEHCRELYRTMDSAIRAVERVTGLRANALVERTVGVEG